MPGSLRQFRVPKAPQLNISAAWLLAVPCLMLATWMLATMTTTSVSHSFRIKSVTPKWNKERGEGFHGHTAIRHLVAIHYKDNEHTTVDFCDHETMPFPYASILYQTSYRNYNASFRLMLHHPETDYGVSGSLFNSNGAYEWKSHLKKIMTNFMDELRESGLAVDDPIVMDVGANIGSTSLWLAALGYNVHAIEPAARNFALMHCSYVINPQLHSRMWLSNVGMSDKELSGVCMKYNQGSKAEAFIHTGRMPYDDYYYTEYEEEKELVEEAQQAHMESNLAEEAAENKEKLDEERQEEQEGSGRKLLSSMGRRLLQEDEGLAAEEEEVLAEELAEIQEEVQEAAQEQASQVEETSEVSEQVTTEAAAGEAAASATSAYDYGYAEAYEQFDNPFPSDCDEEEVNLITLDWYWEKKLNKQQITLLKVDVEGYEHKVLDGAKKLFAEKPPLYVLMEVHPAAMRSYAGDPASLYDAIRNMGYWLIAVDGVEIQKDNWEALVGQEGHLFDSLWIRKQPEGKFDWGLDYYVDYAYEQQPELVQEQENKGN